jgi:hypothetical protein
VHDGIGSGEAVQITSRVHGMRLISETGHQPFADKPGGSRHGDVHDEGWRRHGKDPRYRFGVGFIFSAAQ